MFYTNCTHGTILLTSICAYEGAINERIYHLLRLLLFNVSCTALLRSSGVALKAALSPASAFSNRILFNNALNFRSKVALTLLAPGFCRPAACCKNYSATVRIPAGPRHWPFSDIGNPTGNHSLRIEIMTPISHDMLPKLRTCTCRSYLTY